MKKIFLIIATVIPTIIYSQFKIDTLKAEGSFSKVYDVKLPKTKIHQNTNEWIAINFKDANEVIKMNTEDKIITKGFFNIDVMSSGYKFDQKVYFIMEVAFKENKYKLDTHTFKIESKINGTSIENDYNNYLSCLNYDNYVNYLKSQLNVNNTGGLISDNAIKKQYTKILENPDKIQKTMLIASVFEKQVSSQIIIQMESMAANLFEYINKKKSEEW